MGAQVDVRFLIGWKGHSKGQVIRPCSMLSTWLLERKLVELVVPLAVESAAMEGAPERAVIPAPVKRKRGRPRKVKVPE